VKNLLSRRLQERVARYLLDRHPLPWTTEADWTLEVYDARRQLVIKLMNNDEFEELYGFVTKVAKEDGDLPNKQPCATKHIWTCSLGKLTPEEIEILDPVCRRCGWQRNDLMARERQSRSPGE
jgi:hypothetical protein